MRARAHTHMIVHAYAIRIARRAFVSVQEQLYGPKSRCVAQEQLSAQEQLLVPPLIPWGE